MLPMPLVYLGGGTGYPSSSSSSSPAPDPLASMAERGRASMTSAVELAGGMSSPSMASSSPKSSSSSYPTTMSSSPGIDRPLPGCCC